MCWSGEASGVIAAIGVSSAVYSAVKKMHPALWITLGYFSLMELIQAFTYRVIDNCSMESNQVLTMLGYVHICFQPFFANALSMHFLPQERQKKIAVPVYSVCAVAAIVMLLQLVHFSWAGLCLPGEPLCADRLCSVHGNWHIAWEVPLNGAGITINTPFISFHLPAFIAAYFISAFLMPFFYGARQGTIFHLLLGPCLARLTTSNMNEWPAVWCLLSIGIIMLVIKLRCDPVINRQLVKMGLVAS